MGILEGLGAAKKAVENSGGNPDYVKVNWLTIRDKEVRRVHFLQEIDADSPNYNEAAGLAILAIEHTPQKPYDFKRKFLCTMDDEGKCWGCEQAVALADNKWKAKIRFYANVLVDNPGGEPEVAVISQGFSDKSITPNLISYAEEAGGITAAQWKISRTGASQTSTSYSAIALPSEPKDITGLELFDLKKTAVRDIPYEDQEEYVNTVFGAAKPESSEEATAPVASGDWG